MKYKIRNLLLVASILIFLSSCCTIKTQSDINEAIQKNNMEAVCNSEKYFDSTIIYSGTYYNLNKLILMPWTCHGEGCWAILVYPLLLIGGTVDLPLDILADTLLLPYSISTSMSIKCPVKKEKQQTYQEQIHQIELDTERNKTPIYSIPPRAQGTAIVIPYQEGGIPESDVTVIMAPKNPQRINK